MSGEDPEYFESAEGEITFPSRPLSSTRRMPFGRLPFGYGNSPDESDDTEQVEFQRPDDPDAGIGDLFRQAWQLPTSTPVFDRTRRQTIINPLR